MASINYVVYLVINFFKAKLGQWQWYLFPLLAVLAWLPSLRGSFQFDDYNVIVNFTPVHSFAAWWSSQPSIRPLLKLSYTLNWLISPSAFNFHLFNLCIHCLNGALLYQILKKLFPITPLGALVITLLWFLHPAQTEAVTYIAGRSVSFSSTFLLLALLTLNHKHGHYFAALATLCALLIRETAWIFPVAYALILWLCGHSWRQTRSKIIPSLIVVLLASGYFIVHPYYHHLLQISLETRSLSSQLLSQVSAYHYFFSQPILQLTPNIDPDLPVIVHVTPIVLLKAMVIITVCLWATLRVLNKRCWFAGGVLWFFLLLVPTNSLLPRLDIANDRHLYAPLIGLAWLTIFSLRHLRYENLLIYLLLILFATATLIRNEDYQSELALWLRTSQQSPQKNRVWNNLGVACQQTQHQDCAEPAFQKALFLDKNNVKAGSNLYFLQQTQRTTPTNHLIKK